MVITKKVDYKIKLLESNTLPWNQVKYLKTIQTNRPTYINDTSSNGVW